MRWRHLSCQIDHFCQCGAGSFHEKPWNKSAIGDGETSVDSRQIIIDDQRDLLHVDTSSPDISRDQDTTDSQSAEAQTLRRQ